MSRRINKKRAQAEEKINKKQQQQEKINHDYKPTHKYYELLIQSELINLNFHFCKAQYPVKKGLQAVCRVGFLARQCFNFYCFSI